MTTGAEGAVLATLDDFDRAFAAGDADRLAMFFTDDARQFIEPLQAVVFLVLIAGSVWLGAAILSRRTAYPRWFALVNPVIIQGVVIASYVLTPNPVSTLLLPAAASLSLLILFGFSTALLWNGGREPQPGGRPA